MLKYDEYKSMIEGGLLTYLPDPGEFASVLKESMEYSLSVGGKRLRPVLLLAACDFAGGDINAALPYACAVEYIHTYSLIHDDLPAMDDDDMRRGKPSNHKVYGDAIAILAGDALLNTAAELMSGEVAKCEGDDDAVRSGAKAAYEIMKRAGASGMIAGQTADIASENTEASAELVRFIEEHKTADLITAPVKAGLMLAAASDEMLVDFTEYASKIGIAFQILDDILDFEGDADLMGKTLGKDSEEGKANYVIVHGMDAAKEELHRLTSEAVEAISNYDNNDFFIELAHSLEERNH